MKHNEFVVHNRISFRLSGTAQLDQHLDTKKHKENVRASSTTRSAANFMIPRFTRLEEKVHACEGALAFHVTVHHQSFRSQDCTSVLLREIFGDSEIAQKMTCARTKTEAIVCNVIAPHVVEIVDKQLAKALYVSISTDASNHGHIKLFPIVVQFFDYIENGIQVRMLDLIETTNEKADTVAKALENVADDHAIKPKLTCYTADNTNTNFGGLNRAGSKNIHTIMKKNLNPNILGVGCSAHILHNAAQHGLSRYGLFDIDSLAFKIYQFFSIYTVRIEALKGFCDFVNIAYRDLLYHSKTRWLSLLPVVERLLSMFTSLKSYFLSEEKPPKMLEQFFNHDFAECYLFFVHSLMSVFHEKVKKLEQENNSVVEILNIVDDVVQSMRDRIVHKFLPLPVRKTLSNLRAEGKDKECDDFIQNTMTVYKEAESYLLKRTASLSEFRVNIYYRFHELIHVVRYYFKM